jgi:hypothetical protein
MKTRVTRRIVISCLLAFAAAALIGIKLSALHSLASKAVQKVIPAENRLVVHEWGTFTSIAGKDGVALEWRPLNGPPDLPRFVYSIQDVAAGKGLRHAPSKAELKAIVRMETPVLYFYSDKQMDVDVKVDFPQGKITEWYPQARAVDTKIDWGRLKVLPDAAANYPVEYSSSHYFAARETDAATVQVCATNGKPAQQEKFLFYRGVGTFALPLSVRLEADNITLKNLGPNQIARLMIFENRGGKIGYRLFDSFTSEMTAKRPALDRDMNSVTSNLKQMLMSSGLFEKEADAMLKTWRDNWFEEGLRVFYVLPRQTTDAVLPITIDPGPAELVRVLVGRAEVITPEMEKSVQKQVSMLSDPSPEMRETAMRTIRKYGRFSEPILKRVLETETNSAVRDRLRQLIDKAPGKTE